MDYQFTRNYQAQASAKFELGAEAFGHWFNQELTTDTSTIVALLAIIEQLEQQKITDYLLRGKEWDIALDQYEVEVRAHSLANDSGDALPEGTELDESELCSGCGLVDFKNALLAWQEFIES